MTAVRHCPLEAEIIDRRQESPTIISLTLRLTDPDAARAYRFSPGQFNMLYIAPGNARNLQKLLQMCQGQKIITTTGVPEYVEQGVAVGIGVRQDRPEILINLRSSKSAGSEFDASLLRIARVVR